MSECLSILNEEYKLLPGPQLLHSLIQWDRHTCALEFLDNNGRKRTYSYRSLRKCVLSITSQFMRALGFQYQDSRQKQYIVPVLLPQSPALYIAILAILEAGAAFCPINLDSPQDRIKFVVSDVSARLVITTREYEHLITWEEGPQVVIIDDIPLVPQDDDFALTPSIRASFPKLAYVMYTSGSSGNPKGVAVSHLAVSQSLLAHDRYIPDFKRFLQFAAPSFDVSIFEIFFPLFRGSTLVGCRRSQMLNDLIGVINNLEVDAVELTPTVVTSLVQRKSHVPGLNLLLTIGEMLTRPVLESFGKSTESGGILYAMYGPTEAAIHCTINPQMVAGARVTNIGVPLDTVSVFVIAIQDPSIWNVNLNLLPIGEVGELILGGPQLANEYLNRKEHNEAAFVTLRGQRAYRTGDKARILPDGTIEILGRISSGQFKLRGQRVELGEIEEAIYRHPDVKTVAASVLHGVLVAFVLTGTSSVRVQAILMTCSNWLPSFMVPSEVVILNEFPYLPSGKVDKRKLEADFESRRMDESGEPTQPSTPTEHAIRKIVQDLLGLDLSRDARLSAHGLDSLVAIRMASRLRPFGFNVSPVEILKADNIQTLALACEISRDRLESRNLPVLRNGGFCDENQIKAALLNENLDPNELEYTMPCTPLQDSMLSETAMDGISYKNKIILEVPADFSTVYIQSAVQALAQRNAILRTSFMEMANDRSAYVQVIWKTLPQSRLEYTTGPSKEVQRFSRDPILHPLHVIISPFGNHIQLTLDIHHAIYDAWSLELILDDLEALLSNKEPLERPPLDAVVEEYCSKNYADNNWAAKIYWRDHLSQYEFVPISNFHSFTNIKRRLNTVTCETSIAIQDLELVARNLCVSSQSLFQAAYALILSSYLGTKDICFGTVSSGRTSSIPGIENIIGPCLATLPIRIDLSTTSTLTEMIRQLNSMNRKHLEHCSFPLRDIKKACGVDPGRPLFDSILVWQQTLHDIEHERNHIKVIDSADYLEFNLTLEITPGPRNIIIKANYQQSIFPLRQIDILLRQLVQVVVAITKAPEISLPLAIANLDENLLSARNLDLPIGLLRSIPSSIETIASDDPDRLAIEFANAIDKDHLDFVRVSYSELNSQANRIAHYLVSQNVLPDELVCICMEKSTELYISMLAVIKAGAGYAPVTPDTPIERLRRITSDANVNVILTHSSLDEHFGSVESTRIVFVDRLDFSILSSENPSRRFRPNNLAYCIFTSGSTGMPKGVLVTQGNLLSNLQVLAKLYPHSQNLRLLQSCSQAFDVSVFEIFFAWYVGACLCSAAKDVLFRDIELAIRALEITHLSLTPTVAALVNPENVPKVEFLVTAGEAVTTKVFNAWADHGLYQGYGPSETTNICTVRPNVTKNHAINNIGPPLRNTSVFVVSPGDEFSLVPRGGEGEFYFGGTQVGRGYLDAKQSVGKFIEHPKYGRLYRSGDFGRLLPDGSLSFTGRKDDQVKLRGQRIELPEISSIILRSLEVSDCVSLIVEGESETDQRLVCFWSPGGSSTPEFRGLTPSSSVIEKLFKSLSEALPVYMIPSALIPVSCLPSTTQGKIDRRRLISHYRSLSLAYLDQVSHIQKESNHVWTKLEERIAQTVAKTAAVLLTDIGPDTSFFSLGIDSISAISLSRALRDEGGVYAEISDILKYPSASRLASRVSQRAQQVNDPTLSIPHIFGFDAEFIAATRNSFKLTGRIVENILPCTPLQEAMLSVGENSLNDAYKNRIVFELKVGIDQFQRVWADMIRRHEILRTVFVSTIHPRYAYAQVVLEDYTPKWEVLDKSGVDPVSDVELSELDPAEYDLPYRLRFIRFHTVLKLILSMHHTIYDGSAVSILFEEIEMAIRDLALPPRVSFAPFIQYMTSLNLMEAEVYWNALLSDFSPISFPKIEAKGTEKSRTHITKAQSECKLSWIDAQVKTHDSSLLSVCQAAWASLLSERMKGTDICFGNVVSGRTVPIQNLDRLVAPCFNTVPARAKDIHKMTFMEAFRVFQSQNIDGLPFQLTPLRRIQSRCSTDGVQLFDTILVLHQPARQLDPAIWSIVKDEGAMNLPVVIEITPRPEINMLELVLQTHASYMSARHATEVLKAFDSILKKALENPRHQVLTASTFDLVNTRVNVARKRDGPTRYNQLGGSEPMTAVERAVCNIMANFTDTPRDKIQRHTSIYRLGLDSISAVQVAAALRKQGYSVIGSDVLQNPSIAQLAIHLTKHLRASAPKPKTFDFQKFDQKYRESICSNLNRASEHIETIRPCTSIQCGMLAQSLHQGGQVYINSLVLELKLGISLTKVRSAWAACMRRHEMLRTGFLEIEDSKFPFAMVTYSENVTLLPWIEHGDVSFGEPSLVSGRQLIMDGLSYCPWNLDVFKKDSAMLIRFTAHHAIYDAKSLELIFSEVARHYDSNASLSGELVSINQILEAILNETDQNEAVRQKFWKEDSNISINRFPDLTPLRISGTVSIVQEKILSIPMARLEKLCREVNASIQAVGQIAWGRLLSAYTGESSVTFGLTLSGRSVINDDEKISFPTIVTLPATCHVKGTNAELLDTTMRSNSRLHEHQYTPLTSIQKWIGHPEGKLFDTLFAYQVTSHKGDAIEAPWEIVKEESSADYAVSMEIEPLVNGRIRLRLTVKENLVPIEQARLILEQYDALLLDILQNTAGLSTALPSLGSRLLSITPAAQPTLPSPVNLLHEFVEMQAEHIPRRIALKFAVSREGGMATASWTYKELNENGNKIANLLLSRGVQNGHLIAICFNKCPEATFAILGILKAGCAYVALDPNAPGDRLQFIVQDSQSKIILSSRDLTHTLSNIFERDSTKTNSLMVIDVGDPSLLESQEIRNPVLATPIDPQDACYCLYTSGTTGTPKGCEITHENAVQAMMSFQELFKGHWSEESKWLQFASFHFDVSVLEQFWSWSVGICVASAPRDLIFEDIPGIIRQLGITHIDLTPSLARLLHPDDVPSLTKGVFITGGEQLRQEILDVWGDYNCIYNGYGPTETTIGVTMYPRVPKNGKPSNIGSQFQNVGSYVLKLGTTEPTLRGAIGELCVSGKLLGKRYLNRPELTSDRFPYLEEFGERIYRTGDLVRILHDDSFLFLGRADDQVKLRGQRLELSEINEVIKRHVKKVQDVVTLVLKHGRQQKEQMVTFFIPSSDASVSESNTELVSSLRHVCKGRLPGYMVPTYFIALDKLPLSANNKADFKELAKKFNDMSILDLQNLGYTDYTARKWTTKEQAVLGTLAKILNIEVAALAKCSNIFELGIDSISMIGLTKDLKRAGFRNSRLSTVVKNTSIEALVRVLASENVELEESHNRFLAASQSIAAFAHKNKLAVAEELEIDPLEIECLAPCTPAQEGMVYRFLGSEEMLYFTTFNLALEDFVDEERLRNAWMETVSHLQILRTKFVITNDGCAQVVLKNFRPHWKTTSLPGTSGEDIHGSIKRRLPEISTQDKTVALANPYSLSLTHTHTGRILSLHIFHGLYDGTSLPLLISKVHTTYYNAPSPDASPPFHTLLPYDPLAQPSNAKPFWQHALHNHKYHPLPRLRSSAPQASDPDIECSKTIPAARALHLNALKTALGVTHQALVLAAWTFVLAATMKAWDVTQGVILSGRAFSVPGSAAADDVQGCVGPLFNTVAFHAAVRDGRSWGEFVRSCHAFWGGVVAGGLVHTPLRDVQRWCRGEGEEDLGRGSGDGGGRGLFDTLFVFQHESRLGLDYEGGDSGGKLWTPLPGKTVADYPLAFEAQLNNNGDIAITIVGQKQYLDNEAAIDLLSKFENALQALKSPDDAMPSLGDTSSDHEDGNVQQQQHNQSSLSASLQSSDTFEWSMAALHLKAELEFLSGITSINERASIFSLGLDSIDIIKLVSRLRKRGIHISVSSVVRSQTIAKMLVEITTMEMGSESHVTITREFEKLSMRLRDTGKLPKDTVSVLPATPLQEGMVSEMVNSGFARYFNHEVFHVISHVDVERLKEAWDTVIANNDILRTRFVEVDDVDLPVSYVQVVCPSGEICWDTIELRAVAKLEEEVENIVRNATVAAKDEGKLLHLRHISSDKGQYFVLSIAHALYDGWSLQALHQDVWAAYHGKLGSRPDPRSTLELILNTDSQEAESFWKTSLTGFQKSVFPLRPVNELKSSKAVYRRERPSYHTLDKIQSFCKFQNITLQTLGQTAWSLLLASYLNQLDVVFGVVLSCRDTEEANELMFPLMNTVAVRSVLHGSIADMLQYIQENSNAMRRYQHFPLRRAQAMAGVREGILFDTLFIYQGRNTKLVPEDERLYESVQGVAEVEFAVCVEMEVVSGRLIWRTACKDEVMAAAETEELLDHLDDIIGMMIRRPEMPTIDSNSEGISVCGLPRFVDEISSPMENKIVPALMSSQTKWTTMEMAIQKVLSRVSKIPEEEIHRDQTIFHLGLDSISAIKVSSLLRQHSIRLSVNDIMKHNTVAKMAGIVNATEESPVEGMQNVVELMAASMKNINRQDVVRKAGVDPTNIEYLLPVTAGQLYMLAHWQATTGALFVGTFKYSISGALNSDRFERAWRALLKKHSILRTIFVVLGDNSPYAVQIVLRDVVNDVRWEHHSASEDRISIRSPLSLSVEKREESILVSLRIHHALYDGISLPLLLRDLQALYVNPQEELDLDLEFRHFVTRSCDTRSEILQRRQNFWKSYLSAPTLLHARHMPDSNGIRRVQVFEPDNSIENMALIAQRNGVTIDAILIAAFSKVYSGLFSMDGKHRRGQDVVLGLYLANRAIYDEDLSSLAAPTLNLLPIRIATVGSLTEIAQRIQSDLPKLGSADIAGSSLAEIYEWTGVRVNCFVNILKSTDEHDADAQSASSLFLEGAGEEGRTRAEVVETRFDPGLGQDKEEGGLFKFHEAYLPSIDIEMRVTRRSGVEHLDIGVFAPLENMHVEDARAVIEEIRGQLRALE